MKKVIIEEVTRLTRLKLSCGHYAMPDHELVYLKPGDQYKCLICPGDK